jgi:hypothetical protein
VDTSAVARQILGETGMPTQIDHIILAVSPAERLSISARLKEAGFLHGNAGTHDGGTANEGVAFAGGGFIELLYWNREGAGPDVWFGETPRVQGLGFTTDDYDGIADPWASLENSWNRMFTKTLPDGEVMGCQAAGPVAHLSEFYPFVMDRPEPAFADLKAAARLTKITFAGQQHALWRDRFAQWFPLTERGGDLVSDDGVVIGFQPGPHPRVRLSLTFEVPTGAGVIPISGGVIELVNRPA